MIHGEKKAAAFTKSISLNSGDIKFLWIQEIFQYNSQLFCKHKKFVDKY